MYSLALMTFGGFSNYDPTSIKYCNTVLDTVQYQQQESDPHIYFDEDISMIPIKGAELQEIGRTPDRVEIGGFPAPSFKAIQLAEKFQGVLNLKHFFKYNITPTADGGIAFTFNKNEKLADIEFYNDGEIVAGMSSRDEHPKIWEVRDDRQTFSSDFQKISIYLGL